MAPGRFRETMENARSSTPSGSSKGNLTLLGWRSWVRLRLLSWALVSQDHSWRLFGLYALAVWWLASIVTLLVSEEPLRLYACHSVAASVLGLWLLNYPRARKTPGS